jgi:hypothetical protein
MEGRNFTVAEAEALLPQLTEMLTALQERWRVLQAKQGALATRYQKRVRGNGHLVGGEELTVAREEVRAELAALQQQMEAVEALGCELKDVEEGLIDFPAVREGREIYLCWRLGEPSIGWWHDRTVGFAGRQPL